MVSPAKNEYKRQLVDGVCQILETGPWGSSLENALAKLDIKPNPELVIGVLRRLKDVNVAVNYFRWTERVTDQAHCPEAYNSLLMVMARSRKFNCLEQIVEEMSVAGFGPSNNTCIEIVLTLVKSQKLREAFTFIQTMRKFKFRDAMKDAGLFPNVMTVNIMVDRLCKAQRLDDAYKIFEDWIIKLEHLMP